MTIGLSGTDGIDDGAGGPVTLVKQSAAKTYMSVTYSGGSPSLDSSLNVSSITDTNTGRFTPALTSAHSSTAQLVITGVSRGATAADTGFTFQKASASSFTAYLYSNLLANYQDDGADVVINGGLA